MEDRTLRIHQYLFAIMFVFLFVSCMQDAHKLIDVRQGSRIVFIGNNLCSRMLNYGHLEKELYAMYPDSSIVIRNMCDGGDTPGFRPHSGRNDPWAFPGAEEFHPEYDFKPTSEGHLESHDDWLTRIGTDIIFAFFGYNESFKGSAGLANFKNELSAFLIHSQNQKYNGSEAPQMVLVSPIAFQDLSHDFDLPKGNEQNENLEMYSIAMSEVAESFNIPFVDLFFESKKWYKDHKELTIDGYQLKDKGYALLASHISKQIFVGTYGGVHNESSLQEAISEKNWMWHNDYKMPNGVHVFGRRYDPFGPDNYPGEIKKIRELCTNRDSAIWAAAKAESYDLVKADALSSSLNEVKSNYSGDYGHGADQYLYGADALDAIHVAEGYELQMFASEKEFPDLANPVQLSFDDKGRLWVATMPSYPHYRPGDAKPNDKLIILEDTNGDGKADKQTTFADGLHLPVGFEFAPEGVYVSQGTNLKLLQDTDGDDKADHIEIILSGFDDHDTHHVISAFCADPSGAIYMAEGVFLHTNVESSYGTVRGTDGGFYRYDPVRHHLERTAQIPIPNPWGIAFDEWGQPIFAETSGHPVRWMLPSTMKPMYRAYNPKAPNLIEEDHRVRPTSGLEFIYNEHFPESSQGDFLLPNTIGFLGIKQHSFKDDGTGFKSKFVQDLIWSDDKNFRPVDLEFAPDGSLYIVDWHNVLIGHMQHNARDPLRDHVHGRIYRLINKNKALLDPVEVAETSIKELLENLKTTEYRTRYRSRRALRGRDKDEVLSELNEWMANLNSNDKKLEHHLTEALWVQWGLHEVDAKLIAQLMEAKDFRARASAVRVLRYMRHKVENADEFLVKAASDPNERVRLEAVLAASWMEPEVGMQVMSKAANFEMGEIMAKSYQTAIAHLNNERLVSGKKDSIMTDLTGADRDLYIQGKALYEKDGFCITCHQADGKGLLVSGFPPLSGTKWVQGNEERLIKLSLKGIYGPIVVKGKEYPGHVPMTPYEGLMNDEELAAVLTYIRNSFGNKAPIITSENVAAVRASIKVKEDFYKAEELLEAHPLED